MTLHDSTGLNESLPQRMERKYFIPPRKVELAYGALRTMARTDRQYPIEWINSLYFDTCDLEEHENSMGGDYYKNKVRIRWYGEDTTGDEPVTAYLELKSRQGFASTKQRLEMKIPASHLTQKGLAGGIVSKNLLDDTLARFGYYPSRKLQPIVRISYLRYRFCEVLTGQSMALDCHIHSTMVLPESGCQGQKLELAGAVLEIKGRTLEIPPLLRHLELLDIDWSRFSKYSGCLEAYLEKTGTVGRVSPNGLNLDYLPVGLRGSKSGGTNWDALLREHSNSVSGVKDCDD